MDSLFLKNQLEAALSTLNYCIKHCPDHHWNKTDDDAPFSQVAFHTLFYTDYLLCDSVIDFKKQKFHEDEKNIFGDYEELEDRIPQNLYEKEFCAMYLRFCLKKIGAFFRVVTDESLENRAALNSRVKSQKENVVYIVRHIQHHSAQLGLRLQYVTSREMPWFASGWKDE